MHLSSESGASFSNPSSADIERGIRDLNEANCFAILEQQPGSYMQTMRFDDGYELEYQTGDTDQHYRAKKRQSREQVIDAMSRYAAGDESWLESVDWEPLDLSADANRPGCLGMVLLVVLLATGLIYSQA